MGEEAKSSADAGPFPNFVHRIAKVSEWQEALRVGFYKGTAIDQRDGYIHLSTAKQAKGTAALYFKGQEDLVLITVDATRVGDLLHWDPVAIHDGEIFPHLYAPSLTLPLDAVVMVDPLPLVDGVHEFPAAIGSRFTAGTPQVAYTVRCSFEGDATPEDIESARKEWVAWLTDEGHMFEVLKGGAVSASLLRIDAGDAAPATYDVSYVFPSRAAFERYEREVAPTLKAEGIAKFAGKPLKYSRSTGDIVHRSHPVPLV